MYEFYIIVQITLKLFKIAIQLVGIICCVALSVYINN